MPSLASLLGTAAVLLPLACHSGSEPAPRPASVEPGAAPQAQAARAERAEFGAHRSPVVARLRGPTRVSAGQTIEIVAEVERFAGSGSSVSLRLALPPGTRLMSGKDREVLPAGNGKIERRFVVHVDSVPEGDIELVAATGNSSFGARAVGAYRFGRAEPKLVEPKRAAKDLVLGGRPLGRPIELKPAGTAH